MLAPLRPITTTSAVFSTAHSVLSVVLLSASALCAAPQQVSKFC
ncbi:hypothetical protein [Geodermatophilus maliterrae]|uniref:Uncharacterized protein n=1 Tax=Geodermatophilus maliterrae TaxID=3162531 RepID=A0ABV3XJV1_9ACTN